MRGINYATEKKTGLSTPRQKSVLSPQKLAKTIYQNPTQSTPAYNPKSITVLLGRVWFGSSWIVRGSFGVFTGLGCWLSLFQCVSKFLDFIQCRLPASPKFLEKSSC